MLDLLIDPAHRETAARIRSIVAAGDSWEGEFPILRRDGVAVHSHTSLSPIRDAEGRLSGLVLTGCALPGLQARLYIVIRIL